MKKVIIAFFAGLLIGLAFLPVAVIATHASMASRVAQSIASIDQTKVAISLYHKKTGKLPLALSELHKNSLNIEFVAYPIVDGWGYPLHYTPSATNPLSFEISSLGADNAPGGHLESADIIRLVDIAPAG